MGPKKLFLICFWSICSIFSFSQSHFDANHLLQAAAPRQLVSDYTYTTLTESQQSSLEAKLKAFNDSTSNEIAVVIIPSVDGNNISDYGVELFRHWGIGKQKDNNGVLLLIATGDHELNIATGYGLEGALSDATCQQIIDDIIVPHIKDGDYYQAINLGTDEIMNATRGEYSSTIGAPVHHGFFYWVWQVIKWIFWIIVILILLAKGWMWPLLQIAGVLFSGGGSSSYSGGGGSSFGGFGGGSSGGGGASGRW